MVQKEESLPKIAILESSSNGYGWYDTLPKNKGNLGVKLDKRNCHIEIDDSLSQNPKHW